MSPIPTVSVVMPVYNVERFVVQAVSSVLEQSFEDFELIIVDDGGNDNSIALCEAMADRRTRIVRQANRGLAGARNTGIAAARGEFVAILDSDDAWTADKLQTHIAFLKANPKVGVVYAASTLIDEDGQPLGIQQQPRLGPANARQVFCGQAVQNGSAPVFRKAALEDAALHPADTDRVWYFDERLRRSEDVECWTRLALTSRFKFEAIPGALTLYRVNAGGLSADVIRQLSSWEDVCASIAKLRPDFTAEHGREARARELRYLARRCVQMRDRGLGLTLILEAITQYPALLWREPVKTLTTLAACFAMRILPQAAFGKLLRLASPGLAGSGAA